LRALPIVFRRYDDDLSIRITGRKKALEAASEALAYRARYGNRVRYVFENKLD